MKPSTVFLLAGTFLLSVANLPDAFAAGSDDELEELETGKAASKKTKKAVAEEEVREIVKGFYAKSDVGGWVYLGTFLGTVQPGTSLSLAVGQDFVNKEKSSMAWEFAFVQGIHNGTPWERQALEQPHVQGDLRTYSGNLVLELSTYPARRFGIGARLGGGVLYSPLIIYHGEDGAYPTNYYEQEVLTTWGMSGDPGYHNAIHPAVLGGFTFEYYTKMSHFSLGGDIDAIYAINFDLGLNLAGYLKYTF